MTKRHQTSRINGWKIDDDALRRMHEAAHTILFRGIKNTETFGDINHRYKPAEIKQAIVEAVKLVDGPEFQKNLKAGTTEDLTKGIKDCQKLCDAQREEMVGKIAAFYIKGFQREFLRQKYVHQHNHRNGNNGHHER